MTTQIQAATPAPAQQYFYSPSANSLDLTAAHADSVEIPAHIYAECEAAITAGATIQNFGGVPMIVMPTVAPTPAQLQAALQSSALAALEKVTGPSGQIMRCMAAGVAVPAAWSAYVLALRNIVNGTDKTSTTLPTAPAFVPGT